MNWLDIVGWGGSALLVWSLLQARILRLRALNLAGCTVLVAYNGVLQVWPMVGLNVVLGVINVYYLIKLWSTRHDDRAYAVVPVGAEDGLLAYALDRHGRDIAQFNPGFTHPRPDASAFLVMCADEIAGVVIMREAGGGTAQLELDYVTKRFRDFTPGEFVFRQSGLFAERGISRVVTPPAMVEPYYHRIGFHREGDSYVLDLLRT